MNRRLQRAMSKVLLVTGICAAFVSPGALAQKAAPKYKADVPAEILTPDQVDTRLLGRLEFFDGMPSQATVEKTYDFLDVSRGVETFLNGMPATSVHAALEGMKAAGMKPGDLGMMEELLDARSLFLTPNTTTV